MTLTKYRLGDLIMPVDERNVEGLKCFYGLNINKEFMPTVANTDGLDESKYKIVRKNRFVFSGMQTGRDQCIRIAMYMDDNPIIVSPAYTTFEISRNDIVLPLYFFMFFLSHEKDRLGAFYSDGSIRTNLDWDRFCDIEIELPDKNIQKTFVDVYKSLFDNKKMFEKGVDDLKLACDSYIEDLRKRYPSKKIGPYIEEIDERNKNNNIKLLQGFCMSGDFIEPRRVSIDPTSLKVLRSGQMIYNRAVECVSDRFIVAIREGPTCAVSNSYIIFQSKDQSVLLNKYLLLWLKRREFARYSKFHSHGTAHENFEFEDLSDVSIPIPDIKTQKAIVEVFECYTLRRKISEMLKEQLSKICPILIRGSIEKAKEN